MYCISEGPVVVINSERDRHLGSRYTVPRRVLVSDLPLQWGCSGAFGAPFPEKQALFGAGEARSVSF